MRREALALESVARSAIVFSDMFGPIPDPSFTLIQIPDGTLRGFCGAGRFASEPAHLGPQGQR